MIDLVTLADLCAGLETLDLHGNVLVALPIGLRRLQLLTTLNLVSTYILLLSQ